MNSSEDLLDISNKAVDICIYVVYGALLQSINVFGIITNIINIICFSKQGFNDSVNISLTGLAVSDLGSLITMVWTCVCLTPAVLTADLPFDIMDVMYLTSGMTHMSFTRVSSCVTAMITLERCLCITAPLKIKSLCTLKRTAVINFGVFLTFFWSAAPVWAVNRLGMKFFPLQNRTLVGLISTHNRANVEMITFAINNFCISFGAFIIIVVCTTILSFKLQKTAKWRQRNTTKNQDDRVSSRNQKAAQMVVLISILFIACFIPVSIVVLGLVFLHEFSTDGRYVNIAIMIAGFGHVTENLNSSMNIFIYYKMSSRYRQCFKRFLFKDNFDVSKTTN